MRSHKGGRIFKALSTYIRKEKWFQTNDLSFQLETTKVVRKARLVEAE